MRRAHNSPRNSAQFCDPPPFLPAGDPNWILGTSIVVVDDARPANPTEWTYTAKHMPQTDATLNWFVAVAAAAAQPADHAADAIAERWELLGGPPGSAAYRRAHAEVVYLLGCTNCAPQRSAEKSAVVVARAKLSDLLHARWGAIQYLAYDDAAGAEAGGGGRASSWQRAPSSGGASQLKLTPLFGGRAITEGALVWSSYLGRWYVLCLNEGEVELWVAERVSGPWENAGVVYEIPAPWDDASKHLVYAVKAHPELAPTERHIAFSFATNALELPSLFMADGLQT